MTTTLDEFLGAEPGDACWRFSIPLELHGAFGGAFGGVVAAATVLAARSSAPGRTPLALDIRFLRGLPPGTATATPTVLHSGRTLSTVTVDLAQPDGKLAARATVSLVNTEALAPLTRDGAAPSIPSYDDGRPWPPIGAPIIETLAPRTVEWPHEGNAIALRVPWSNADADSDTSAEAACLPADMCVGPPVGLGIAGEGLAHPNPDISLRFAAPVTSPALVGVGRLERVHSGIATVGIEVWGDDGLCAVGVSTSTLIPAKRP
jgi:acyl-coenzyme A thioesterase PaaI-like protein